MRGPGVPYSQIRILARARWQLFHLKGVLSRGGLKPHVVLAGDNAMLEDTGEEEDPELASDVVAGNSRDKVQVYICQVTLRAWNRMRHARTYCINAVIPESSCTAPVMHSTSPGFRHLVDLSYHNIYCW